MFIIVRFAIQVLILSLLAGCSQSVAPYGSADQHSSSSKGSEAASARSYEPSLGTAWGERIESQLNYVSFERENRGTPDALATIYYDDKEGVRELSGLTRDRSRPFQIQNGEIEFGLTDEESGVFTSPFLPGLERGGKLFVRGKKGDRYAIYLKNRSEDRIEVVLSVDGIDVMNGRDASFEHRGYIVNPGAKLVVEGFRDSRDSVAAFRFSDPKQSYSAETRAETTNVGVIGLALFNERGTGHYARQAPGRRRANPFPGEFAPAP